jgi:hypothetical protein
VTWKPDYITAEELAVYLRIGDSLDDAELAVWATASSRAVDRACNRQFGQVAAPVARVYRRPPVWSSTSGMWCLDVDDVMDTAGMTVDGVALAAAGVTLMPENAAADGRPYTRIGYSTYVCSSTSPRPAVSVVARWGWNAFPAQVIGACKLQGSRWNARRESPYGIAGSPDQGSEMRLLARLDPDVATTLTGLVRPRRVG